MSSAGAVIVVGGGLAGITAALRLADEGREVTVLEGRPRLGGATYSFHRDGLSIDTGQHVFLRCYDRYRALLARLGVADLITIQRRLDIPVLAPGRPPARLRRSGHGPAPLHLLPALASYRALSPADRFHAARGAGALRKIDPDDPVNDEQTFGDWLRRNGQRPRVVSRLWALLTIAALNIEPAEASLALAARVFRHGLLDDVRAGDIGVPQVPLESLHDRPAREAFSRLGVRLHTGERARAIVEREHGLSVRTEAGELEADAVVVAVPHAAAARLVPEAATPAPRRWDDLGDSPIVNAHILYERRVTDLDIAAVLDSDAQWIFDRTSASGLDHGQYLVSSISAADAQIQLTAEQIRQSQIAALARVLPGARGAGIRHSFVTREPRATFRQRSGTARIRPPAHTKWTSLVLAGAWTATGWPDTMEGAVRSGEAAAEALCPSGPIQHTLREVIA